MARSQAVIGFWLAHCFGRAGMVAEPLQELFGLVASGDLRVVEGEVYGLSEVRRAHEDMQARKDEREAGARPGPVAPAIPHPAASGVAPPDVLASSARRALRPAARSPEALLAALARDPHTLAATDAPIPADPLSDEDLQLALYLCYELHYRGLPGVSDEWEWEPSLLALRRQLEARFEAGLLDALGAPEAEVAAEDMDVALRAVEAADEAPSLSRYLERDGTHARDARVHRAPLGLPAQGGRPALVGAAAPDRRAEGRDGRDPGRRVRRRQRRAHAQRAVRQVDGPPRARRDATAPTSTASRASRSRP